MAGRSFVTIAALVFVFQEYDATAITVTDVQWKAGLIAAGRQSWLIAKMQFEFLMIAKGVNVSKSKAIMEESISLFDSQHIMLRDGNGLDIVEAPSQAIVNVLGNVQAKWSPFKMFLKDNVANTSLTVLTTLDDMGSELYWLTQICASRYVDAISGAGANFSGLQVNTANRQSMLVEKMAAEAFLLHFGVHPDTMLNRIVETRALFVDAHAGILEGLNFVGLEATVNKCISQVMRLVTFLWDEFKEAIDTVIFEELASDNSLNDIAAKIAGLRTEAAAATLAYADPPLSCPTTMTRRQWQMAFDVSTRQLMHAQKACRLFLQAAKGVNTLDSRILFSNSDASATADLKMMREGSVAADMAAAPTHLVSEKYGVMWLRWLRLAKIMAQNINFVSDEDHRLLQIVEDQGKQFVNYGFEALENIFTECKLKAPEVNCEELKVTGVQRILIQKAAFEAVLIGLERNVTENKKEMIETIARFEGSQSGLIHQQPGLPRTLDICILQEMEHVDNLWTPFKSLLLQVHDGDHSVATLLTIWGMTWDAGVDPMSAQLTVAMRAYAEGRGVCTPPLTASRQELESAIKELGFLRAGTQKLAKHFLLSDIGIDSAENMNIWHATLKDLSTQLERIISGDTSATLPVPIVQVVADRLFDLAEDLADVQSLTVDQYAHASLNLLQKSELAINAYVDAAFDMDPNVPGARSSLASTEVGSREGMVWISVGIRSRSWWIVNDEAVLQHSASCTGSKVSSLLQGALFITGLGASASQAKQPLDCYDGYTSDSLLDHIHKSIAQGYNDVTGNSTGAIEHPHVELMGAGADAICVQAKAIQHMLLDHDISELRSPQEAVYNKAVNFIRDELQIEGVSGPVKFSGNDKPGRLGLWQLSGSERIPVGTVYENGTIETGLSEGLQNETWLPAFPEPTPEPFPMGYVVVSIGVFMISCPILLGCIVGHNGRISALFAWKPKGSRKQDTSSV
ncbi:unnamed protein product [Effrenium voratum]|uniref:Uncharacterized protein n=1 Tax=Effrenium voratum TaxID=2562239 RepID=A0AA36NAA8_9DINO|nr:unnamed protein product [Effrenium voratum]